MNWKDRIEVNPAVLVGKPIIKGTRISVELILDRVADAISQQFSHQCWITYAQHTIKGNGCQLAASVAFAKIDRRVRQRIGSFNFACAGQLACHPCALIFFLD